MVPSPPLTTNTSGVPTASSRNAERIASGRKPPGKEARPREPGPRPPRRQSGCCLPVDWPVRPALAANSLILCSRGRGFRHHFKPRPRFRPSRQPLRVQDLEHVHDRGDELPADHRQETQVGTSDQPAAGQQDQIRIASRHDQPEMGIETPPHMQVEPEAAEEIALAEPNEYVRAENQPDRRTEPPFRQRLPGLLQAVHPGEIPERGMSRSMP